MTVGCCEDGCGGGNILMMIVAYLKALMLIMSPMHALDACV